MSQPNKDDPVISMQTIRFHPLISLIGSSIFILFLYSSIRHLSIHSTGLDLGIFDQAVYLISRGLPPISSFLGFHILGDHAALCFYGIAPLYRIYPDVHWLLMIQAVGLSLGAIPTYALAGQAGLTQAQSLTLATVYLLCPVWFNANLFDFHPDTLAPVGLLTAVWAARSNRTLLYILAVLFVLSLKDAFSLVIAAMGIWLFLFEKKRSYGVIALIAGVSWFFITTQWIVPTLSGMQSRGLTRYKPFGNSPLEIAQNIFLKPELTINCLLTLDNLRYLGLLFLPLIWGLAPRHLASLVGAAPMLLINLLSETHNQQRTFKHYYSASIIPFLLLAVIDTMAANNDWIRLLGQRLGLSKINWVIITWAIIAFVSLGRYGELSLYLSNLSRTPAFQSAVALISPKGSVLTDNQLAPHVSHRLLVHLVCGRTFDATLAAYDNVLLDGRFPSRERRTCVAQLLEQLQQHPDFQLRYQHSGFYLFVRKGVG